VGGTKAIHLGLMILRLGAGTIFAFLGYPALSGGIDTWRSIGQKAMEPIGIEFAYPFWGFMAAAAMSIGGLLVALGLLVRPAAFLLAVTMGLATYCHSHAGNKFDDYYGAPVAAVVFLALLVSGGGDYAAGSVVKPLDGKWYQ